MTTVKDMLMCPKCRKKLMGKSHPQRFGKEYYAHCCHQYFGVNELVNQWGYDAGDLFPYYPVTHAWYKPAMERPVYNFFHITEFDGGEPNWVTEQERVDAYQMVSRMFLGIEEIDDYIDLQETEYNALGIGVQ